jgi:hypothetical protein
VGDFKIAELVWNDLVFDECVPDEVEGVFPVVGDIEDGEQFGVQFVEVLWVLFFELQGWKLCVFLVVLLEEHFGHVGDAGEIGIFAANELMVDYFDEVEIGFELEGCFSAVTGDEVSVFLLLDLWVMPSEFLDFHVELYLFGLEVSWHFGVTVVGEAVFY